MHKVTRGMLALLTGAAVAGVTALTVAPAQATTSVEGNCLLAVLPVAVTPSDTSTTTITISWSDECTNVDYYNVERSSDSGATWTPVVLDYTGFTHVNGSPTNTGSVQDSPTDCDTYLYRVDAVHAPGQATPKVSISLPTAPVTLTTANSSCDDNSPPEEPGPCTLLTGGHTIGFYSNKNGQNTIDSGELAHLRALNLVKANGDTFDPANYAALKTWLLNATATNMSYMLSAQLAALTLNIDNGYVSADAELCEAGYITIGDLAAEANAYLGAHPQVFQPSTGTDPLLRADGDALKTLIDEINNNLVTVS